MGEPLTDWQLAFISWLLDRDPEYAARLLKRWTGWQRAAAPEGATDGE